MLGDIGKVLSPINTFFILQGIETVALRMDRNCEILQNVPGILRHQPLVDWVNYLWLQESMPGSCAGCVKVASSHLLAVWSVRRERLIRTALRLF
ncbi:PLP-dependent transferase [Mangrovimicrobium sediminis]|uniref:PLP-dependent transferase n=1 Tax=Mangrovimicrobium sediminis TaxID=2562682 RepID=UPI00197D479A|nr:PLP-dependent transferase [Haliea sp. SAOS-164]